MISAHERLQNTRCVLKIYEDKSEFYLADLEWKHHSALLRLPIPHLLHLKFGGFGTLSSGTPVLIFDEKIPMKGTYYGETCPTPSRFLLTRWTEQLAQCLNGLHQHGWLHRDVKPANLLLSPTHKYVYLCDFNLACRTTNVGEFEGTELFASDQVLNGARQREEDDWISLAFTMFALENGRRTWETIAERPNLNELMSESFVVAEVWRWKKQLTKWRQM